MAVEGPSISAHRWSTPGGGQSISAHGRSTAEQDGTATRGQGTSAKGRNTTERKAKANKTSAKWDRKLANRTAQKEGKQKAKDDFKLQLEAPILASGRVVTGSNKEKHRIENKRK